MRIAISTSVIQRGKSGVGQYVLALVRALLRHAREHEFRLLVLEEDIPLFAFASGEMEIVPVAEKWRPALKNIAWHQAVLPGLLRSWRTDVLHIPSYRRMLGSHPCALVSTIHDLAPFHVSGKYDLARMFYGRVVVKWLARRQDGIVAISTNTARDIERFFGIPVAHQNIVLNGLDHSRFFPGDPRAARERIRTLWGMDAPYFLYVSRIEHPAKNHVRLIEAFTKFKAETGSPWTLALGGSDWHGAEVVHAAAAASPFASHIKFLGFVSDEVLPDLYRGAGAMVYPSLFEGFGLPPVEAMACGCPVVSSTRGSLEEVVGNAALRIEPERVEDMASALSRVSRDESEQERLRELGLANALRFDWDRNAEALLGIYRTAVQQRISGRSPAARELALS